MKLMVWIGCAALALRSGGDVLVDTDFGSASRPVSAIEEPGRRISGVLPEGWRDDSAFNRQVEVAYEPSEEAGIRFLRITRGAEGHAQIRFDPGLPQPDTAWYRLSITARSPSARRFHAILISPGRPPPWRSDVNLTAEWKEHVFEFTSPPSLDPPFFQLQLPGARPGMVEIQQVRIERRDREALKAAMRAAYPEGGGPGNLARNSRFPLGPPPAWVLSRELDDAETGFEADPDETGGPSGVPALRFAPPRRGRYYSAPLPVRWSFGKHTLSLSVKSRGPGRVLVLRGGDPRDPANVLAEAEFGAATGWRRLVIPFQPQLAGNVHVMAVETASETWIDALSLEYGLTEGRWAPPPGEVALAMSPGEVAAAGARFEDESWDLRVAALSPVPTDARLRLFIVDLYGKRRGLPPIPAGEAARPEGLLVELPRIAERRLGVFRVEGYVETSDGGRVGGIHERVMACLPRPRFWGADAPDSPFGVHVNPVRRDLLLAKATGHNWARLHDTGNTLTSWWHVEPEPGVWTWRDAELRQYRDHHLMILGMLSTSPGWANGSPGSSFWSHAYLQPLDLEAWETYVRVVTTRYAGSVAAWEVWNEPWLDTFWRRWDPERADTHPRGVRDDLETIARAYADLTRRAVRVARETVPDTPVFGFNATSGHGGIDWVRALLASGAAESPAPGGFSYHAYVNTPVGYPADACFTLGLPAVAAPLREAGIEERFRYWMTEGGSNRDSTRDGLWKHVLTYENRDDVRTSASEEARFRLSTLAGGAERLFAYAMHGFGVFNGAQAAAAFMEIKGNGGAPHPSAVSVAVLQWHLDGLRFAGLESLAEGVWLFLFTDGTRTVGVVSTEPLHADWSDEAPAGWRSVDLWGNPARPAATDGLVYISGEGGAEELVEALK